MIQGYDLSKKKIYIAGAGGMLGEAFFKQFYSDYQLSCSDIDVNEEWLSYLDFRDYDAYETEVNAFQPDYLFHIGAFTDLEYCELHPEDTNQTNTESVKHAVTIANNHKIMLLYISTAGIFNGNKDYYDESDEPSPIGCYASSKYLAERYVQEHAHDYLICRAGWMMGGGPKKDKKFIQKLLKQIKDGKTELHVINDKFGTPTYTHDFSINVKLLVENDIRGLFNMVCGGLTGRLEVAKELISIIDKTNIVSINEVDSSFFSQEFFASRPNCEQLVNQKLNDLGLNRMKRWEVSLRDYIRDYYTDYLK